MINTKKIISGAVSLLFIVVLLTFRNTSAQSISQPIITWQANNFFPSDYAGKDLPSPGTRVTLSLALLRGGKLIDLSGTTIHWYVDGNIISNSSAPTTLFVVKKPAGDSVFIRTVVEFDGVSLENSTRIPVVAPSLVVPILYPGNLVPSNSDLYLKALPFFFNISSINDIGFSWKIGDRDIPQTSENGLVVKVGAPAESQKNILVSAFGQNNKNPLEVAKELIQLKIY